ncbi:hypothetical protein, partial [Cytobacillus sp. Bac17]|uniref:hypothetical protein n=2 Tax=Cytobacillus TaxID=2675230 RepID=UPI0021198864
SWRPFFCLWLLFRLHESFMETIFLPLVPFSASSAIHGDHFFGFGAFSASSAIHGDHSSAFGAFSASRRLQII